MIPNAAPSRQGRHFHPVNAISLHTESQCTFFGQLFSGVGRVNSKYLYINDLL